MILKIGQTDVSEYIEPSGLSVAYAPKFGESVTMADGTEKKAILGQTVTVNVPLKKVGDTVLADVRSAVVTAGDIAISCDGVPTFEGVAYKITSFKQTLAYKVGNVNLWDLDVSVSCYVVSDGL